MKKQKIMKIFQPESIEIRNIWLKAAESGKSFSNAKTRLKKIDELKESKRR